MIATIFPNYGEAGLRSRERGEYFASMMLGMANKFDGDIRLFFDDGTDDLFEFNAMPGYVFNLVFSRDWAGLFQTEIETRGVSYRHNADYASIWTIDGTTVSSRESSRSISMMMAMGNILIAVSPFGSAKFYAGIGGGQAKVGLDNQMSGSIGCSQTIYGAAVTIKGDVMADIRIKNISTNLRAHLTNSSTSSNSSSSSPQSQSSSSSVNTRLQQLLWKIMSASGSSSVNTSSNSPSSKSATDAYISGLGGRSIEIGMRFMV